MPDLTKHTNELNCNRVVWSSFVHYKLIVVMLLLGVEIEGDMFRTGNNGIVFCISYVECL